MFSHCHRPVSKRLLTPSRFHAASIHKNACISFLQAFEIRCSILGAAAPRSLFSIMRMDESPNAAGPLPRSSAADAVVPARCRVQCGPSLLTAAAAGCSFARRPYPEMITDSRSFSRLLLRSSRSLVFSLRAPTLSCK